MQQPNIRIDQFFDLLKKCLLASARIESEKLEIEKRIDVIKHEAKTLDALLQGRMYDAVMEQIIAEVCRRGKILHRP